MLAYLLILGVACAVAYGMAVSGKGYGRAIASFLVAVFVGWFGGGLLAAYGAALLGFGEAKQHLLPLFLRGLWWALIGAGIGVFRARRKSRPMDEASTLALPKWGWNAALAVILAGFMLALALPAYQDYTKRSQKPWEVYQAQQSAAAQATPDAQIDWGSGDIVIPQASTDSSPATDAATNEHLHRIYAAHPDADAIFASADFVAWMARYPAYQRIAAEGTTQEVIEMFTAYKNQRQPYLYESNAPKSAENPKTTANSDRQPLIGKFGNQAPQNVLSKHGQTTCVFRPVMSDADYRACGISPPSR